MIYRKKGFIMSKYEEILDSYNNDNYIDVEISGLKTNKRNIAYNGELCKVDIIYLQYYSYLLYPGLVGYSHDDKGNYDHEDLCANDILNADLDKYIC